jgi:hypothetical protein
MRNVSTQGGSALGEKIAPGIGDGIAIRRKNRGIATVRTAIQQAMRAFAAAFHQQEIKAFFGSSA